MRTKMICLLILISTAFGACSYTGPKVTDFAKESWSRALASAGQEKLAKEIDHIFVIGDSLSDTGNLHRKTWGMYVPEEIFYKNRFSNGPLWIDYVSTALGVSFTNLAVGGAETGEKDGIRGWIIPGTDDQITQLNSLVKSQKVELEKAVAVLWVGPNNYFYDRRASVSVTISDIERQVNELEKIGFKKILVGSMPNLDNLPKDPRIIKDKSNEEYRRFSLEHQAAFENLVTQITSIQRPAVIQTFDAYKVNLETINNPKAHGFENLTDACYEGDYSGEFYEEQKFCSNPIAYKYWDFLHPNTLMHCYYGAQLLHDLNNMHNYDSDRNKLKQACIDSITL